MLQPRRKCQRTPKIQTLWLPLVKTNVHIYPKLFWSNTPHLVNYLFLNIAHTWKYTNIRVISSMSFFPNHIRETEDWETFHGCKVLFPSHPHAKSGKYSKWCIHLTPGMEWSTYHWQSHTLKYKLDPYLFSCLTLYWELINRNLKWRRRA